MKTRLPGPVVGQLANGLRFATVTLPRVAQGYAVVMVRTGPRFEDARTHGISHLCEHMLFRGAGPHRNSLELNQCAESFMGTLEASTFRDHAVYGTAFAPGHHVHALQLLAHMMIRPRMATLSVEKRVLLEEIREAFDEDGREIDADNLSRAAMYPGHPAGLSIDGTVDSVRRFTTRHLREHHRRLYVASNMVVVVAGPVGAAHAARAIRASFSGVPTGRRAELPAGAPRPLRGPRVVHVNQPGSQTTLRVGWPGPPQRHDATPALQVARRILDDGYTSRFQAELVDRRGLAYEMWADVDTLEDCGAVDFGASVSAGRERITVAALLGQSRRLAAHSPTAREVRRAHERLSWQIHLLHEHAASVAEWQARALLLGRPLSPAAVVDLHHRIRGSDVRAACAQFLDPAATVVVAVGPVGRTRVKALRTLVMK